MRALHLALLVAFACAANAGIVRRQEASSSVLATGTSTSVAASASAAVSSSSTLSSETQAVSVSASANASASAFLQFSPATLTMDDLAAGGEFKVQLAYPPTSSATVYFEAVSETFKFSQCSVTFDKSNYGTPQTIKILPGSVMISDNVETKYAIKSTVYAPSWQYDGQSMTYNVQRSIKSGGVCSSWGDPHFIRFDGRKYSHQGSGAYYLLKSDNMAVQSYQAPCVKPGWSATCNTQYVVKYGNSHVVIGTSNIDGTGDFSVRQVSSTLEGIKITKSLNTLSYNIRVADGTWMTVTATPYYDSKKRQAYYLNIQLNLSGYYYQKSRGLCGVLGSDKKGVYITSKETETTDVTAFAESWKVSDSENLFFGGSLNCKAPLAWEPVSCVIPQVSDHSPISGEGNCRYNGIQEGYYPMVQLPQYTAPAVTTVASATYSATATSTSAYASAATTTAAAATYGNATYTSASNATYTSASNATYTNAGNATATAAATGSAYSTIAGNATYSSTADASTPTYGFSSQDVSQAQQTCQQIFAPLNACSNLVNITQYVESCVSDYQLTACYESAHSAQQMLALQCHTYSQAYQTYGQQSNTQQISQCKKVDTSLGFGGQQCPNQCSGHGSCEYSGCVCRAPWAGADCSINLTSYYKPPTVNAPTQVTTTSEFEQIYVSLSVSFKAQFTSASSSYVSQLKQGNCSPYVSTAYIQSPEWSAQNWTVNKIQQTVIANPSADPNLVAAQKQANGLVNTSSSAAPAGPSSGSSVALIVCAVSGLVALLS